MKKVYIIDGARTPFIRSLGSFSSLMAHELGNFAVNGLLRKVGLDVADFQYLCMGNVLEDPATSNLAREIVLESMLSKSTPGHTVTMACISSNVACTTLTDMIAQKHIDCGIAGGAETFSDLPIRLSKNLRQSLLKLRKSKGFFKKLELLSKIRLKDFKPDFPSPKEFSIGISMGDAGDQLAARFDVSRAEADAYALLSHKRAAEAWEKGYYDNQVISVSTPREFLAITKDNGPRPDSTPKILAGLKPSFNRFGINTAANSSFFSDGASALMLASDEFCKANKLKPLCQVIDYCFSAGDPANELLYGPAISIPILLKNNALEISNIDVWEIHEAFAAQVLAIRKAINQECGEIPLEKMNLWGGSLSLGHPFGATGTRLLLTAGQRLEQENGEYAIVSGCAAGGLGSAILLKRA